MSSFDTVFRVWFICIYIKSKFSLMVYLVSFCYRRNRTTPLSIRVRLHYLCNTICGIPFVLFTFFEDARRTITVAQTSKVRGEWLRVSTCNCLDRIAPGRTKQVERRSSKPRN